VLEDRVFRCGQSDYYKDEILVSNQTHTAGRLRAISESGFNGIWLHAKLRELVPGRLFGTYVTKSSDRLQELANLCRRAKRYGLGVWLYLTEPLGLPASHRFWKNHREISGPRVKIDTEEPVICLCPSTDMVQEYLTKGFAELFQKASLAGVILITASEHPSHCFSHVVANPSGWSDPDTSWATECSCPRCVSRGPAEVVASVISLIQKGIKSSSPKAKVVAWDWSWNLYTKPPYRNIVNKLSEETILMGDFERGGIVSRGGRGRTVEEYSLMYPGPSSRFKDKAELVQNKRPLWAKLQINTTHELATVPNMPLVVSLYRKFKYLRKVKAAGYMATWNFACSTDTLNVFAVNRLSGSDFNNNERSWLLYLARAYFGDGIDAEGVVNAWYAFQRSCRYYPLGGENCFLYYGPTNYALSHPLKLNFGKQPFGPSWMKHEYGDRPENSVRDYTLSEITLLLGKFTNSWSKAVVQYEKALSSSRGNLRTKKELATAIVAGCSFRSTYNIYRWYLLRKRRNTSVLNTEEQDIVNDELSNVRIALPLVETDEQFGFHEEAQWRMYTPTRMKQKIRYLKQLLEN